MPVPTWTRRAVMRKSGTRAPLRTPATTPRLWMPPGSVLGDVEKLDPSTEEVEEGTSSSTEETEGTIDSASTGDAVVDATEQAIADSIGANVIDEKTFDLASYDPDSEEVEEGTFDADATAEEAGAMDATPGVAIVDAETFDPTAAEAGIASEAGTADDTASGTIVDEEIVDPYSSEAGITSEAGISIETPEGETIIDDYIFGLASIDPATDEVDTAGEGGGRD